MHTTPSNCVLVAEDEPMLAMLLGDMLGDAGYRVLLAETLPVGLSMARDESIDAAVLDVTLGRDDSFPLADALRERQVPFLFASGHGREVLPQRFANVAVLRKPFDMRALCTALDVLLGAG